MHNYCSDSILGLGNNIDSTHIVIEIPYRDHDSEIFTITIVRILHVMSINYKLLPVYYSTWVCRAVGTGAATTAMAVPVFRRR